MKARPHIGAYLRTPRISLISVIVAFLMWLNACAPTAFDASHPHDRTEITITARGCLGAPYRWGGATPAGFDCSGLVCYVYRKVSGISLPHNSSALYRETKTVTIRNSARGDLVFFSEDRAGRISHVGIYLGGRKFIHATSSRGVIISSLDEQYYHRRFVSIRRVPLPRR